eukprot:jgi/Mesvir1/1534/Mv14517-RA.1
MEVEKAKETRPRTTTMESIALKFGIDRKTAWKYYKLYVADKTRNLNYADPDLLKSSVLQPLARKEKTLDNNGDITFEHKTRQSRLDRVFGDKSDEVLTLLAHIQLSAPQLTADDIVHFEALSRTTAYADESWGPLKNMQTSTEDPDDHEETVTAIDLLERFLTPTKASFTPVVSIVPLHDTGDNTGGEGGNIDKAETTERIEFVIRLAAHDFVFSSFFNEHNYAIDNRRYGEKLSDGTWMDEGHPDWVVAKMTKESQKESRTSGLTYDNSGRADMDEDADDGVQVALDFIVAAMKDKSYKDIFVALFSDDIRVPLREQLDRGYKSRSHDLYSRDSVERIVLHVEGKRRGCTARFIEGKFPDPSNPQKETDEIYDAEHPVQTDLTDYASNPTAPPRLRTDSYPKVTVCPPDTGKDAIVVDGSKCKKRSVKDYSKGDLIRYRLKDDPEGAWRRGEVVEVPEATHHPRADPSFTKFPLGIVHNPCLTIKDRDVNTNATFSCLIGNIRPDATLINRLLAEKRARVQNILKAKDNIVKDREKDRLTDMDDHFKETLDKVTKAGEAVIARKKISRKEREEMRARDYDKVVQEEGEKALVLKLNGINRSRLAQLPTVYAEFF